MAERSSENAERELAASSPGSADRERIHLTLSGLVTDPEATFRRIADEPPVGWAVGIVVVVSLVYGLNAALAWGAGKQWMGIFLAADPPGRFALAGAVVPVVFWVLHPLLAGILRLVARILGGQGDFRGMFACYAFALVPSALTVIGVLPSPFGLLGALFAFWTVMLMLYAVRANERLSQVASLAVLGLPLLVVATAITAVLALT